MKKIFTLVMGLFMTVALFAADRRPSVIINSARNFEIVVDGRSYVSNGRTISLDRLMGNRHTIQVYEMRRSFFGTRRSLVSQSSFRLVGNNDLMIRVNAQGNIMFKESRNYGRNDRWDFQDDRGWNNGRDRDIQYDRNDRNDRDDDRYYDRSNDRNYGNEHSGNNRNF